MQGALANKHLIDLIILLKTPKLLQDPDNDNIDLRNIIIEDKKEKANNGHVGAPGRPDNYYSIT